MCICYPCKLERLFRIYSYLRDMIDQLICQTDSNWARLGSNPLSRHRRQAEGGLRIAMA